MPTRDRGDRGQQQGAFCWPSAHFSESFPVSMFPDFQISSRSMPLAARQSLKNGAEPK